MMSVTLISGNWLIKDVGALVWGREIFLTHHYARWRAMTTGKDILLSVSNVDLNLSELKDAKETSFFQEEIPKFLPASQNRTVGFKASGNTKSSGSTYVYGNNQRYKISLGVGYGKISLSRNKI